MHGQLDLGEVAASDVATESVKANATSNCYLASKLVQDRISLQIILLINWLNSTKLIKCSN